MAEIIVPKPRLLIDGHNPFNWVDAAELLFDQTQTKPNSQEPLVPEGERFFPLYPFQNAILTLAALYRFIDIIGPSQGGKTTAVEVLAALMAIAYPGENILILSTREEQAERLLYNIKTTLFQACTLPEFRVFSRDTTELLVLQANNAKILALPHSFGALTGNPARVVIFDEIAKWDKDPQKIYNEGIARTGKTGGHMIAISTHDGEGVPDKQSPNGYRGNFYHYVHSLAFNKRHEQHKHSVAVQFPYQCSPHLIKNIDVIKAKMCAEPGGIAYFNEHYLCIPRKSAGKPVYGAFFKRSEHVKSLPNIPVNPNLALFLCFDPGLNKSAILGQLDLDCLRLVYLLDFLGDVSENFETFVKKVYVQCKRRFKHFEYEIYADQAAKQTNDQTLTANAEIIAHVIGQYPYMQWMNIAPGIQTLRSFMQRRDAFFISDECKYLPDAFETGLVHQERNGQLLPEYVKDGYWEHIGDAARYPPQIIMGGLPLQSYEQETYHPVYAQPNPYTNPYTGY